MLGSALSIFNEPDDFQAALRESGVVDLVVTSNSKFWARLAQITLNRMRLFACEEHVPRVAFMAIPPNLIRITLPPRPLGAMMWDGLGLAAGEIVTHGTGHRFHERTGEPCGWSTIWVPARTLADVGRMMQGAKFVVPSGERRWHPSPEALKSLMGLHESVIRATATRPKLAAESEAARGLEQQLVVALIECLAEGSPDRERPSACRQPDILIMFEETLQAAPPEGFSVTGIAEALGVSVASLRTCCHRHLGMAPGRYLYLRQVLQARRAHRDADPS